MPSRALKVLSISDRIDSQLLEKDIYEIYKDVDLILSCGDLPYYHIEKLFQLYEVPVLYVRGNHDPRVEYGKHGPIYGPRGGIDLHNQVVILNNLIFAGLEGSLPYKDGPFLYSQGEMWRFVLGLIPRLMWKKLLYGRFLDVFIAHSPPFGIHDQDNNIHGGYKAFRWLIKTFKPAYFFHGHIHVYTEDQVVESIVDQTKVINTYGYRKSVLRPGQRHRPPREKPYYPSLASTAEDFRDARRRAALENIWGTLTGSFNHLIQFQQVEDQLQYEQSQKLGLQDIPLDAIVGSVNRPNDFTRKFFPREPVDPGRWQRVKNQMDQQIRPIELYQIDEVYFVLDGNHRVSVARQRGMNSIPAYVTKIESAVPLTPEDNYDDVIIKNQQVQFRKDSNLEHLRPDLEFDTSYPGAYQQLQDQIIAHQLNLEMGHHHPYTYQQAAENWVEDVYLPLLKTVSQSGLLRDFPDRTPTDLYIWLTQYQEELSREYGWEIKPAAAVDSLAAAYGNRLIQRWKRFKKSLFPEASSQLAGIGDWRRIHLVPRVEGQIFSAILVGINGKGSGWLALEQALIIARKENSSLRGLHVIQDNQELSDDQIRELEGEFRNRTLESGISASLYLEKGEVVSLLNQRAQWNDLLVFSLEHPPQDSPASRLRSNLHGLIHDCPRPLLAVRSPSPMTHALLAFDGSPKAIEAMYLAVYLVEKWGIKLTVATALEDSASEFNPLDLAREYLESREIQATLISDTGLPSDVIITAMKNEGCDFIIVGGYGHQPVIEVFLGSTLNGLLRKSEKPILICH
ncbi:MAG: hypothetical protein E4H33_01125 [Anaerolineales bacterium]|nr:MAG: hypothetical protein E4H33_01125 [Anaerolineales bacterium]